MVELAPKLSGTVSFQFESRDSAHSITSQLLSALIAGNLLAALCLLPFNPFPTTSIDFVDMLVLSVGAISVVALALLFLASTIRRAAPGWWTVAVLLNVTQVTRLAPAVMFIAAWPADSGVGNVFWALVYVPVLSLLTAVGMVMTVREARKSRRRRLARAAAA